MNIHEKFTKLRELYPDDIARIEAEQKQVTELLKKKEYYALDTTKALIALCRKDVVMARLALATDRKLVDDPAAQRELWAIVDARLWFIERVAQNYDAELDAIDQELEAELHP